MNRLQIQNGLQPNLADDFLFNDHIQHAINNRMNNPNHDALRFIRQHQQRQIQQNERQSGKSKRASPLIKSPIKKTRYSAGKKHRETKRKYRR
jgi:hypothetical protein